jgi:hypothetical protein
MHHCCRKGFGRKGVCLLHTPSRMRACCLRSQVVRTACRGLTAAGKRIILGVVCSARECCAGAARGAALSRGA